MDLNEYIQTEGNKGYLRLKVIPNSSKNEVSSIMEDGTIKIRLRGVPENGKLNLELIKFISKNININQKNIHIISGNKVRNKLIRIDF